MFSPRVILVLVSNALSDLYARDKAVYTASSEYKNDQGLHQLAGTSRFSPKISVSVTGRSFYSLPEGSDYGTHPRRFSRWPPTLPARTILSIQNLSPLSFTDCLHIDIFKVKVVQVLTWSRHVPAVSHTEYIGSSRNSHRAGGASRVPLARHGAHIKDLGSFCGNRGDLDGVGFIDRCSGA